jgi:uncharacterized protein (TIGR00661 family)
MLITGNNFNKNESGPRILISPLDWGLGHATRCIPIIYQLIELNCTVFIAADKNTYSLLKKEFPTIVFLRLKGYEIKYSKSKRRFLSKILLQVPGILFTIRNENKWLKKIVRKYHINAVISDNRPGLYHKDILCIYITHQLFIKTGNVFTEKIAQRIHSYFIRKYASCWVPDFEINGLAGVLSHQKKVLSTVVYTGPLSRFKQLPGVEKIYDVLILLSGPEPQRTLFEQRLLSELKDYPGNALLVRGLPAEQKVLITSNESVKIINHLSAQELNIALEQSKMVISRSGYTTIMDLVKLNKSAILVPTPGQTEQEYLAKYLSDKKYFYTVDQENFCLNDVLEKVKDFPFESINAPSENYKQVINQFVLSIKTGNFAPQ